MISKTFIYQGLFVLLILFSLLSNSFEAVILLAVLLLSLLLFSKNIIISKTFYNVLFPLFCIVTIALTVGLFHNKFVPFNFLKDFLYLIKPALFLIIGYLFAQRVKDENSFFKIIIYTAVFCAIYHIYRFIVYIIQIDTFSMNQMRSNVGLDNFIELFALAILISNSKYQFLKMKNLKLIILIISVSSLLYFSRTMFALIIVVTLALLGYLRFSKKGIKYISIGLLGLILFYTYLFSIDIPRNSKKTVDVLFYKLKLAPSEIFVPSKSYDIKNHATLWDHWRAYEAAKAIELLNNEGVLAWSFGLGAGSLVDLGFNAPLSDDPDGMRYISNLHNGYAFVLYKTGILGILFYFMFLGSGYVAYKKYRLQNPLLANTVFSMVLFYLATSLVITGIYNISDPITLVLGGILFLNHKNS